MIADIININDQLQELDVSGNRLDLLSAYQIGKALKTNETLRTLKVSYATNSANPLPVITYKVVLHLPWTMHMVTDLFLF